MSCWSDGLQVLGLQNWAQFMLCWDQTQAFMHALQGLIPQAICLAPVNPFWFVCSWKLSLHPGFKCSCCFTMLYFLLAFVSVGIRLCILYCFFNTSHGFVSSSCLLNLGSWPLLPGHLSFRAAFLLCFPLLYQLPLASSQSLPLLVMSIFPATSWI